MTSQQHGAWKDNQFIVHLWFRSKGATSLDPYPQEKRDSRWSCIYHGTLKRKHPLGSVFHLHYGTFMDFHCRVCLLEGGNPGRAEETIKHADKLIMILFTSHGCLISGSNWWDWWHVIIYIYMNQPYPSVFSHIWACYLTAWLNFRDWILKKGLLQDRKITFQWLSRPAILWGFHLHFQGPYMTLGSSPPSLATLSRCRGVSLPPL